MNIDKLKEFIDLALDSGVVELKYKGEKEEYFVSFAQNVAPVPQPNSVHMVATQPTQSVVVSPVEKPSVLNMKEITSPFVGTFYASPSPGSEAYVKVGDAISPGKVLCIVEAMKIMNEIEAEISGEIAEICVENETYVEFGQVLFRVKP